MPIPGTKRRRYLEENIKALDVQLTADDMQRMRSSMQLLLASPEYQLV